MAASCPYLQVAAYVALALDSQQLAELYLQALATRRKKTDPEFQAVAMQVFSSSEYARAHTNTVRESSPDKTSIH
jgi:hypothetical protein